MRKWRCTVCGYIHTGPEPPEICPVCGAGREAFVDDGPAGEGLALEILASIQPALFQISYGLFVLGTRDGDRINGSIVNSFMQVAESPLLATMGIHKTSLSWEYLRKNPFATVSILGEDLYDQVGWFGLQSGRSVEKFAGRPHRLAANGCPILEKAAGFLELRLAAGAELDAGSHTVFLAEIINGGVMNKTVPVLTYARYRELKAASTPPPDSDRRRTGSTLSG